MRTWLKGNRTRIISFLIAVAGIVQQFAGEVFPQEYSGTVLMAVAIVMLTLRQFTTTAPGKAE